MNPIPQALKVLGLGSLSLILLIAFNGCLKNKSLSQSKDDASSPSEQTVEPIPQEIQQPRVEPIEQQSSNTDQNQANTSNAQPNSDVAFGADNTCIFKCAPNGYWALDSVGTCVGQYIACTPPDVIRYQGMCTELNAVSRGTCDRN